MHSSARIKEINSFILDRARVDGFAGNDPFDGLNSRLLSFIPSLKKNIFGLVWIQLFKRSAINLRPLLAVKKQRNPKGVGLFILGLLEDYKRTQNDVYLSQAVELASWLLGQQSQPSKWKYSCWGYHFDWMARAFFVPKGKPNVITTVYVARALHALSMVLEETNRLGEAKQYRKAAFNSAEFIVKTLYTEAEGRSFFAYIPGEIAFVHNASLWAAAWVAKVGAETGNSKYCQLALKVARQSVSEQNVNGSWVYGARGHHQFIDGFHTGYNLEALDILREALNINEFDTAIKVGLAFYKSYLFEADGTAKYYHDNRYPLDMHSVSQAILTLLMLGDGVGDVVLVKRIINRSIASLYMASRKQFAYQKHKYFINRINYVRWTQAWVYYSFAVFNRFELENLENLEK